MATPSYAAVKCLNTCLSSRKRFSVGVSPDGCFADPNRARGQVRRVLMGSVFACAVQDLLPAGGGDRYRCVPQPPRGEGRALKRLVLLPRRPHGVEGMQFNLACFIHFNFYCP